MKNGQRFANIIVVGYENVVQGGRKS